MSDHEERTVEILAERLTRLEELYMHLQRTMQELDGVAVASQKRLDALEGGLSRLARRLDVAIESLGSEERGEQERPPHY